VDQRRFDSASTHHSYLDVVDVGLENHDIEASVAI
jgi:hypothetical protein